MNFSIIPLRYIIRFLGKHFKFHSNSNIPNNVLYNFPSYYKDMIQCWIKYFSHPPTASSKLFFWFVWKIKILEWPCKRVYLSCKLFFKWCQLIDALPKSWKNVITDDKGNYRHIVILSLHLLRDNHVYTAQKWNFH